MIFVYKCADCELLVEKNYRIGKAPSKIKCLECKKRIGRYYGSINFLLKGSGWPGRTSKQKKEQTEKNKKAERRMWKERGKPKSPYKIVPEKE